MSTLFFNHGIEDERELENCRLMILDSSIGPGAWLLVSADPNDPSTGVSIPLDQAEVRWITDELATAVEHARVGDEYETSYVPETRPSTTATAMGGRTDDERG